MPNSASSDPLAAAPLPLANGRPCGPPSVAQQRRMFLQLSVPGALTANLTDAFSHRAAVTDAHHFGRFGAQRALPAPQAQTVWDWARAGDQDASLNDAATRDRFVLGHLLAASTLPQTEPQGPEAAPLRGQIGQQDLWDALARGDQEVVQLTYRLFAEANTAPNRATRGAQASARDTAGDGEATQQRQLRLQTIATFAREAGLPAQLQAGIMVLVSELPVHVQPPLFLAALHTAEAAARRYNLLGADARLWLMRIFSVPLCCDVDHAAFHRLLALFLPAAQATDSAETPLWSDDWSALLLLRQLDGLLRQRDAAHLATLLDIWPFTADPLPVQARLLSFCGEFEPATAKRALLRLAGNNAQQFAAHSQGTTPSLPGDAGALAGLRHSMLMVAAAIPAASQAVLPPLVRQELCQPDGTPEVQARAAAIVQVLAEMDATARRQREGGLRVLRMFHRMHKLDDHTSLGHLQLAVARRQPLCGEDAATLIRAAGRARHDNPKLQQMRCWMILRLLLGMQHPDPVASLVELVEVFFGGQACPHCDDGPLGEAFVAACARLVETLQQRSTRRQMAIACQQLRVATADMACRERAVDLAERLLAAPRAARQWVLVEIEAHPGYYAWEDELRLRAVAAWLACRPLDTETAAGGAAMRALVGPCASASELGLHSRAKGRSPPRVPNLSSWRRALAAEVGWARQQKDCAMDTATTLADMAAQLQDWLRQAGHTSADGGQDAADLRFVRQAQQTLRAWQDSLQSPATPNRRHLAAALVWRALGPAPTRVYWSLDGPRANAYRACMAALAGAARHDVRACCDRADFDDLALLWGVLSLPSFRLSIS